MNLFLVLFLVLFPLLGGVLVWFLGNKLPKLRKIFAISINALELIAMILLIVFNIGNSSLITLDKICGIGLSFKVGTFNLIYGFLSVFLWMVTITFSKEYMHHYQN